MDEKIQTAINNAFIQDRPVQTAAYYTLMEATEHPVDWAYEVWDLALEKLKSGDNHDRSIAAQLLSNLAKSDPEGRIFKDFDAIFAVVNDNRSVTARHTLQAIWKIGLAGEAQKQLVVGRLADHFKDCVNGRNVTLVRYDIIQDLKNLYDATGDEAIKTRALGLIDTEDDLKYRKKYAGVWKEKKKG